MAALLVAMTVMALVMSAAVPQWQTVTKREREAELIFRGEQYARAIQLFQRKYANTLPSSVDQLVNEHFLRRKYLDPITGGEFQLLGLAEATAVSASADGRGGLPSPPGRQGGAAQPGAFGRQGGVGSTAGLPGTGPGGRATGPMPPGAGIATPAGGRGATGQPVGGIMGVASRSTEKSLRQYRGRGAYNEWAFVPVQRQLAPGGPGAPGPGLPAGTRGTPTPAGPGRGTGLPARGRGPGAQTGSPFGPPTVPGLGGR